MNKITIVGAFILFCLTSFGILQASDSDDLDTNPQIGISPQVETVLLKWSTHSDAKDLIFHINILKLLRSGSNEEAIKILEKELIKKGEKTDANNKN